jgi:hypothetical protein
MHIRKKRRSDISRILRGPTRSADSAWPSAAPLLLLLVGCASPGKPLPPSLNLPQAVSSLAAARIGDEVTLTWVTPSRSTDKLLTSGQITAEICRDIAIAAQAPPAPLASQAAGRPAIAPPCSPVVLHLRVTPGDSEAIDQLPPSLASGTPRLLAYRVQLRNAAGHTAGASIPVYAAAGEPPQPVQNLHGKATKGGAILEWTPGSQELVLPGAQAVELDRTTLDFPAPAASAQATLPKNLMPAQRKEPVESRFRPGTEVAAPEDPGGMLDRSAQIGRSYRYFAQRVRTVVLSGQTLEIRSLPSQPVTVAMLDVFPPEVPAGLLAVPGRASANLPDSGTEKAGGPAIDLSWEPDIEPRVAGYRIYRRDVDSGTPEAWHLPGSELVKTPSYRDFGVTAGQRYAYRVTAVSEAGNESAPSGEVVETAPAQ